MDLDAADVRCTARRPAWLAAPDPADAVAVLYREHAVGLIRLAHVMLANRAAAEDVVQDAFFGLYRRWNQLDSKDRALGYVRSSVLNGCRTALRRRAHEAGDFGVSDPPAVSAEAIALISEERQELARALWRLPDRQREVLVLRYYLDLPDDQVAQDLGVAPSTIRSIRRRALSALKRSIKEKS